MLSASGRWPLHPQPYRNETRRYYVERVAEAYGVGYFTFCWRMLGLDRAEAANLGERISDAAALRLTEGTGVSAERLREMEWTKIMGRNLEQLIICIGTEEGRRWFEALGILPQEGNAP